MKKWSRKGKWLFGVLVVFILAQTIKPTKNNGNPAGPKDIATVVAVPDSVMLVLKTSCYDCHSDYTSYPWYDRIAPVSWWVANHINEGKRHFNFTTFGDYPPKKMDKKLKEVSETVKKGEMPLDSYLWIHKDAQLNAAQKELLKHWVVTARAQLPKQNTVQ